MRASFPDAVCVGSLACLVWSVPGLHGGDHAAAGAVSTGVAAPPSCHVATGSVTTGGAVDQAGPSVQCYPYANRCLGHSQTLKRVRATVCICNKEGHALWAGKGARDPAGFVWWKAPACGVW